MADWYLTDGKYLLACGHCQDGVEHHNARDGAHIIIGKHPEDLLPPPMPEPGYAAKRSANYPSIGEQLDCLWHAMDDGILPKVEPFFSKILAVKQAHPKTSN